MEPTVRADMMIEMFSLDIIWFTWSLKAKKIIFPNGCLNFCVWCKLDRTTALSATYQHQLYWYAWILKLLSKHVRDGFNLIEFDFFPFQVLHLFGNFVHGISLDLQLVEYLQLFEFAHFIQCNSLIHACTEEISVHIGISKELAGIWDQRFTSLECYQNVWKSINSCVEFLRVIVAWIFAYF